MHIPDSIRNALFEEDATPAKQAPVAAPHPMQAVPQSPMDLAAPVASATSDPHDGDAYQKVLVRTDYTKAPLFAVFQKYLAPMADMPMDDKTKFSIALKQAQAQEGLDVNALLKLFDDATDALQKAVDGFAQATAQFVDEQVTARNKKAADLEAQAHQLKEDAFAAQQKSDQAKHNFDVAVAKRSNEIASEKSKYASLLV